MKTMDNVKKRIITSMVAIILLIITIFGITYAYFISNVAKNKDEDITASAGKLALTYGDGNEDIIAEKIIPGTVVEEKTFTVKNTGTAPVESYEVIVENVTNTLEYYEDLTYTLTCKSLNTETGAEEGTCDAAIGVFPKMESILVTNYIDTGITHSYVLTLTYNETNKDQSNDMNKEVIAKVNIKDYELSLKKMVIYGNSLQDGTPTPASPIEIKSVGDETNNLFNANYLNKTKNYTVNSGNGYYSAIIKLKSNTTYTLITRRTENTDTPEKAFYAKLGLPTDDMGSLGLVAYYLDSSNTFATNNNKTITTGDDGLLYFSVSGNGNSSNLDLLFKYFYFQLVEGTEEVEYEPYGYKIPVKVNDKNLLNPSAMLASTPTSAYLGVDVTELSNANPENLTLSLSLKEGKTVPSSVYFGFVGKPSSSTPIANWLVSDGVMIKDSSLNVLSSSDIETIAIAVYPATQASWDAIMDAFNVQLEINTKATSYKSYIEPTITNIYLDEPLRKVGDYVDYIDFKNNKLVRQVGYKEITSSSISSKSTSSTNSYNYYFVSFSNAKVGSDVPILSNIGGGTFNEFNNKNKEGIFTNQNSTFFMSSFDIATLDDIKDFVTDNEVYTNYVLDKQIEEYIELPSIRKFGINSTVKIDTEVEPSKFEY